MHSAPIWNLIKLKGTAKLTAHGERVWLKHSKYILFEILAHRTWKGSTSSCRLSQRNAKSGLIGREELVRAFHVLNTRISKKNYLESLRHTCLPCAGTINVFCKFVRLTMAALCQTNCIFSRFIWQDQICILEKYICRRRMLHYWIDLSIDYTYQGCSQG